MATGGTGRVGTGSRYPTGEQLMAEAVDEAGLDDFGPGDKVVPIPVTEDVPKFLDDRPVRR